MSRSRCRGLAAGWMLPALLAAVTTAATAEGFEEVLAGRHGPLTLKLRELDGEWRRFRLGGGSGADGGEQFLAMMLGAGGAAGGSEVYYTKGRTVHVGGEVYLVAWRLTPRSIQAGALTGLLHGRPEQMPPAEKPTPDTELALSLLHLRTAGNLLDIRPFSLELELTGGDTSPAALEQAREQAARALRLEQLRHIGAALLLYVKDGERTLPPMNDVAATQRALLPYGPGREIFTDPRSGRSYLPNSSLAGRKYADIPDPGGQVAFYEPEPVDNTRGVLFLDGRVARVPESEWNELKRKSNIP
jgi:hypothetical protein